MASDIDSNFTTANLTEANLTNPASDYYLLRVMRQVWSKCIHKGNHPKAVYVSEGIWNLYESILQPLQEFKTGAIKEAADGGFQTHSYKGVPLVYDEYCPAGYLFFDNPEYCGIKILSNDNFKLGKFQEPVNQKIKVAQITLSCQFVTDDPRHLGVIQVASAVG